MSGVEHLEKRLSFPSLRYTLDQRVLGLPVFISLDSSQWDSSMNYGGKCLSCLIVSYYLNVRESSSLS